MIPPVPDDLSLAVDLVSLGHIGLIRPPQAEPPSYRRGSHPHRRLRTL